MNRSHVEISVIVPFQNEQEYIEQCIESLLIQDLDPAKFELIFIDNNSTDSSLAIVSKYKTIQLLHEGKCHVYAARNTAISKAKGNILAFTDADCTVTIDWLTSIMNEFAFNKADILLGERYFSFDASYMSQFLRDYENSKNEFFLKTRKFKKCFGYANNMAIKSQIYDQLGGFREDIPLGDTEFVLRYIKEVTHPKISYSDDIKINHLEIGTWLDWLRKLLIYGKGSPKSGIPLYISWTGQIKLYRYCIKKHRYSILKLSLFIFSAACANVAYLVSYLLFGGRPLIIRGGD